jgi:hypothetical protein
MSEKEEVMKEETKEETKEEKVAFDVNSLVGKDETTALNLAKTAGWKTRVKERDGAEFFGDMQYIETRANLYITKSVITKVEVG